MKWEASAHVVFKEGITSDEASVLGGVSTQTRPPCFSLVFYFCRFLPLPALFPSPPPDVVYGVSAGSCALVLATTQGMGFLFAFPLDPCIRLNLALQLDP